MPYTMPGTFPGAELISEDTGEEQRMRKVTLHKTEAGFRKELLNTMHTIVLLELLVTYWYEGSFLRLVVKAIVEYFVYQYDPAQQRQLLTMVIGSINAPPSNLDLDTQLALWRKLLFIQMVTVNLLVVVDHLVNYDDANLIRWSAHGLVDWLNDDCHRRQKAYSTRDNFRFGSVFINFIGELRGSCRVGLVAIDLTVAILQYVIFRSALLAPEPEPEPDESSSLVSYEDGYQGGVNALCVDVYPAISMRDMVEGMRR